MASIETATTPVKLNNGSLSRRSNNNNSNDDTDVSANVFPTEQLLDTTGRYEIWSIRIPRAIDYGIKDNQQYELQLTHDEQGYDLMLVDDDDTDPNNDSNNNEEEEEEDNERRVCYFHIGDTAECENFRIIPPPIKNNDNEDDDELLQPIGQFTKHVSVMHYQPIELLSDIALAPPINIAPAPLEPKIVRYPYKNIPTKHGLKRRWYPIGGGPPANETEHTSTEEITTNQFQINNVTFRGTTSNRLPPTCTINFPTTNNNCIDLENTFYDDDDVDDDDNNNNNNNNPIGFENSPSNKSNKRYKGSIATTPNRDNGNHPIGRNAAAGFSGGDDNIYNNSAGTSSVTVPVIKMEISDHHHHNVSSKHDDSKEKKKKKDNKEEKEHKKNKEEKKERKEKKEKKEKKDKKDKKEKANKDVEHKIVKQEQPPSPPKR